jgi:hypothetical protein
MRSFILVLLALCAGGVDAGTGNYQRGDFSFSVGDEPGFVDQRPVPQEWDATAPGASDTRWRYWLYDIQADRRAGQDMLYVEHVFEPRAESMIGEAGRFQIQFNPAFQKLMLHRAELRRNGEWHDRLVPEKVSLARRESGFENDLADGVVTALIVLDDVRVNDVLRISYTIAGSNPVLQGDVSDWARFAWGNPALDVRLRVLMDPARTPRIYRENTAPEPVITHLADAVEVTMAAHGSAQIVDEEQYPSWYRPYPLVQVAADRSWADVVAWALPLYPSVDTLPEELEAKLQAWSQLPDEQAKVQAALRTVQDQVRYFGVEMGENSHRPTTPAETWRRRYGDCKDKVYLLVTLLRRLRVRAVPALVDTDRGRAAAGFVPSASVFNHVIARVQIGKRTLWLDPTITHQGGRPDASDLSMYGAALPVQPGVVRMQPIDPLPAVNNGITSKESYAPEADGKRVRLEIETVYRGNSADRQRRAFAGERIEDLQRRYADYYRKRHGELEVVEGPKVRDDRERNIVTVSERYLLNAPFEAEGAAVKALDVYADALQAGATLPRSISRTSPVDYIHPGDYRHEIEVALPDRWKPTFVEEHVSRGSAAFDYRRDIAIAGARVSMVHALAVKQPDVAGDQASPHLGEVRRMQDDLSARLRFHASGSIPSGEREARLKNLLREVIQDGSDAK